MAEEVLSNASFISGFVTNGQGVIVAAVRDLIDVEGKFPKVVKVNQNTYFAKKVISSGCLLNSETELVGKNAICEDCKTLQNNSYRHFDRYEAAEA